MNVSAPESRRVPFASTVRFHVRVRSLFAPPVFSVVTFIIRLLVDEFRTVMFRTSNGPLTTFQK